MAIYNQQVDLLENSFYPTGMVIMWPSDTIPQGWLKCDGTAYSYTAEGGKYKALYDVIGTSFGTGTEGSSFKVPDMRDRFVEGASSTHAVGTYVEAGLPEHTHTFTGSSVTSNTNGAHSHTKNTLNVTGYTDMYEYDNSNGAPWKEGTGCFSIAEKSWLNWGTKFNSATSGYHYVYFTASKTWAGSLSYQGNHSHTFTAKGTIDNASSDQAVYGKSSTVQPKSLCLNYIIKY